MKCPEIINVRAGPLGITREALCRQEATVERNGRFYCPSCAPKAKGRTFRLGSVQRNIVAFLSRCEGGAFIGCTCKAEELRGYDWVQVERSLAGLMRRGIIRKERISYFLVGR